eukprot:1268865-Karenia_brevis.AAC.1
MSCSARHGAVPLHCPRCVVVEGRWKTLQELLFNGPEFMRNFTFGSDVACVCHRFKNILPAE